MSRNTIRVANEPEMRLVDITPELAERWLGGNHVNRNLRERVVDMYARDMAAGNWLLTGEAIKRSSGGKLLDGQHRLAALVKSGCTVTMCVAFNVEASTQPVMDSGVRRNTGDALTMAGYANAATYASLARIAIGFFRGDKSVGKAAVTNSEVYEWLEDHPEVGGAVDIAVRYQKKIMCPPSVIAFASYLIWQKIGNWSDVDEFWCAAAEKVGLTHGDPVIALTDRFTQDRARRQSIPRMAQLSAIVRAWNYRRQGKPMMRVLYESPQSNGLVPVPEVIA